MRDMPTSTTQRKRLGYALRRLRERAELELKDCAPVIERSWSVLAKLERGRTGIYDGPLRNLVTFYKETIGTDADGNPADGGDPIIVDDFVEMNREAKTRGSSRWRGHHSVFSEWFRDAVDFERDASSIHIYQTELVHGLLQTESYMRALFAPIHEPNARTAAQVKARLERQETLDRPDVEVTAILSESCLRRMIGNRDTMLHQMLHLAEVAMRPNVTIHVLPFASTVIPKAHTFPFVFFRIPSGSKNDPPLEQVLVEQFTTGDYWDGVDEVNRYSELWTGLLGAALDPAASRNLLLQAAKEYE
jgi:hypothetical protein